MKKYNLLLLFIGFGFIFTSCEDLSTNLDTQFAEDPTPAETVSENTAKNIFRGWYNTVNAYEGPGLAMTTMADMGTCSWGNQGMRDMSSEPRIAWNNSTSYGYRSVTQTFFNSIYALLSDSNNLLAKLANEGPTVYENPKRVEALARFGQAAYIGYIGLVFDRVWLTDEDGARNNGESVSPMVALDYSLEQIDKAIQIAENNTFDVDSEFINGVTLTSAQFAQFLNTFAARLMVNMARNSAQRDATDWQRVLNYANKGLTYDLSVVSDGWTTWYSEWIYYQIYPGWGRVDMRVINLMVPSTIDHWTSSNGTLAQLNSADSRLTSDMQYQSSQWFIPSRGLYHYSNYRHSRYDGAAHGSNWTGAMTEMLQAENELYKAEAQMRLGNLAAAAATINASSRVLRGGLAPVAANASDIADAIHYERSVELMNTGMGLGFFEMRRENLLQVGTPLHFPIPGSALEAAGIENYTFGGTTGVAGEDYSTGGWR